MPRKKNNYSAELKVEVVLEALEGEKTYQQIGLERGLDPQLIGNWVKQIWWASLSALFRIQKRHTKKK